MKIIVAGNTREFEKEIIEIEDYFKSQGDKIILPRRSNHILERIVLLPHEYNLIKDEAWKRSKSISECDLFYIVNPNQIIDASISSEIGSALAYGKQIAALEKPQDRTLALYVTQVFDPRS